MKTLTKGVSMKRNTQANDGKILRYSLRKYKLGLASVTIGAIFLSFSAVQVVKADEAVSTTESSTQVEPADSSLTTSGLVTETPTAPVTAENTSVSKVNEPVSLPEGNTGRTETTKLTETSEKMCIRDSLGVSATIQTPVVVDGEVVVRPIMGLCLTIDHRIVDLSLIHI